ncbi:RICIN domain-containing protein [Actinoplanes sp. NPDC049118]|uniref:RICIN domain-containing protein n=1 Tax=Actinoplanes sp. NPDC049118 TaxID=3155769 RepID=UPI0033C53BCF
MSVRRRFQSIAVTVLLAAGLLTPGAAAEAGPPPGPTDVVNGFLLVNMDSRRCLRTAAGTALAVQGPCRSEPSSLWRMRLATLDGLFQVQNLRGGGCLSAAGGAAVVQFRCDEAPSRRWRLLDGAGDTFLMRSVSTGRCVAVVGGGAVVQGTCADIPSRRWHGRAGGGNRP